MFSPAVKGAALVTGAAKGLGRVIALRLAADGFNIAISDLPCNKALLEELKREITTTLGRRSTVLLGDVSSETDVKEMVGAVTKHLGSLDVVRTTSHSRRSLSPKIQCRWSRTRACSCQGHWLRSSKVRRMHARTCSQHLPET